MIALNEELAIEMESKAVELDPLMWINYSNLSMVYVTFNYWERSLEIYQNFSLLFDNYGGIVRQGIVTLIGLNRANEAGVLVDKIPKIFQMEAKALIAIAQGETDSALIYIQNIPQYNPAVKADCYLKLGMWEEAAQYIEQAYIERDSRLVYYSFIKLPEDYPDHPALQKAFDKPELNALFEIRRKNLKNNALLSNQE